MRLEVREEFVNDPKEKDSKCEAHGSISVRKSSMSKRGPLRPPTEEPFKRCSKILIPKFMYFFASSKEI